MMVVCGTLLCLYALLSIAMNETTSPVSSVFDLQRNAIEQTREAVKRGAEAQQEFGKELVDFSPVKQANDRSYEAVRSIVEAYFEAIESVTPVEQDQLDEFHASIEEQLDTLEANQTEAVETAEANVREGIESIDSPEEFMAVLDEQFEAVLEANEDVKDQTVEAFKEFEGNLEELQDEFEALSEEGGEASDISEE